MTFVARPKHVAPTGRRWHLLGDPAKLQQALQNCLDNAVKFTESGTITVRARVANETLNDVLLRFEVTDTGIGIAPEDVHRLFSLFEQGDNSNTRRYAGVGLGLVSTPLVGSTFWFTAAPTKAPAR
ncbi:hypothetical protein HUU62_05120 [Rhodoferax sp. 4810]|nr:hypothetical protein [Rhodoferax jenense]